MKGTEAGLAAALILFVAQAAMGLIAAPTGRAVCETLERSEPGGQPGEYGLRRDRRIIQDLSLRH